MNLRRLIHRLRKSLSGYKPLVEVRISRENLLHNLHAYQKAYPALSFAPVLKSNAYGHGLVETAEILDQERVAFFAVDSYYEARVLRAHGIRSPLLVVGYTRPEDIAKNRLRDTAFALVDIEQVRALARGAKRPIEVHLKLDTGMHRHGITESDLPEALALLSKHPNLRVTGICTHLGDADSQVSSLTDTQLASWKRVLPLVTTTFPALTHIHLAATKGVRFAEAAGASIVRVGIGLYGLDTSPGSTLPLRPVLEVRTVVSSVRAVRQGEHVGYNATFEAARESRIATIPMGYYEGVDRRLSSVGSMLVNGKSAPIAGRVSMNMTSLDVTDIPDVKVGDTVIAVSRDPKAPNSVRAIALETNRIPYDVLTHVPPHLRRVVE